MNSSPNGGDRERILAELARREGGEVRDSLPAEEESTLAAFGAELDTLVGDLRQPPPIDAFEDESGCRRAVELAEQVGLRSDAWSGASDWADSQELALERVGPYQITARLGRGGMGAVYRAIHNKLKRVVAVKVLPATRMKDAGAIARFEREMEAIGALNHPNIVTAHDAGEVAGMHYLVMECVEGLDLAALARRAGPLPIADACEIVRQAAQGLKAANDRGIVHRDLKPSNLMLAQGMPDHPEATVKVLDFGLARLAPLHAELQDLTSSGQIMGTLKYMAPEQCSQSHAVDVRADIYSLGATLYKLLCGSSPFSDERFDSPLALLAALGSEDPPRLAARRNDVPPKLEAIVHRMIAKKPGDRFASPSEVIDALTPWTHGAQLGDLLERARDMMDPDDSDSTQPRRHSTSNAAKAVGRSPIRRMISRKPLMAILLGAAGLLVVAGLLLIPTIVQRLRDSTRPGEPSAENGDPFQRARSTAEWLQSQGATMEIAFDDTGVRAIGPDGDLPEVGFHLISASLAGNKGIVDGDLARFDDLPFFHSLLLNETPIGDAGLGELGHLPLIKCLYLSETRVTDAGMANLERYPQLTTLHLHGTAVTDAGLRQITELRNLTQLYLVGCRISDDGLAQLANLTNLATLWLEETDVTAAGIAKLRLALPHCLISSNISEREIAAAVAAEQQARASSAVGMDADSSERAREVAEWLVPRAAKIEVTTASRGFVTLQPGDQLPDDFLQLITANLDGNQELSNEDLARFDKLPSFTWLSAGQTNIDDAGLRRLGELPLLQMLFLPETFVADAGLEQLQRYPRLEVLHLADTQVTDAGLVHLAGHTMLYDLALIGCDISDEGLKHLTGLKRLRILALNRTGVTPRGIVTFQQSLPDCEVRSDYSEEELAQALKTIREEAKRFEDQ